MKYLSIALLFVLGCSAANKDSSTTHPSGTKTAAAADLGNLHHPISTQNAEAQRAFDQGLSLVYAFNHDESIRSFKRASELDPSLAMAHWGVALALGPNYNDP